MILEKKNKPVKKIEKKKKTKHSKKKPQSGSWEEFLYLNPDEAKIK